MQIFSFLPSASCLRVGSIALCVMVIAVGCNQRRYKPSKWRPAARNSTLPAVGVAQAGGSTLPTREFSTLPNRNWSTLPTRNWSTLPTRNWSTLPGRGQRGAGPGGNWSTLPNRGPGGTTLPGREYPEYRVPQRNWSTLPQTVPKRGGSTLPLRIKPLRPLR
jgi:hypothetical protein